MPRSADLLLVPAPAVVAAALMMLSLNNSTCLLVHLPVGLSGE